MGYDKHDGIKLILGCAVDLKEYSLEFLGTMLEKEFDYYCEVIEHLLDSTTNVHHPCVHNDHDDWIVIGKVLEEYHGSITSFQRAGDEYPMTHDKVRELVSMEAFETHQYYRRSGGNYEDYEASDRESLPDLGRRLERLQKLLDTDPDSTSYNLDEIAERLMTLA